VNSVLKMGALKKQETLGLPVLEPPFEGPTQKMSIQQVAMEEPCQGEHAKSRCGHL
jgi:hypothetical protein